MTAKSVKRPLTQDEIDAIDCLSSVRFLPGSWDKRFNRDVLQLAATMAVPELSEKAIAQMWRILIKYRRQWDNPRRNILLKLAQQHAAPDFRKINAATREQSEIDKLKEKLKERLNGQRNKTT